MGPRVGLGAFEERFISVSGFETRFFGHPARSPVATRHNHALSWLPHLTYRKMFKNITVCYCCYHQRLEIYRIFPFFSEFSEITLL
jgi:hypothetical protein